MNILLSPWRQWHRPLVMSAGFFIALMVISGVGIAVDDRVLLGESTWVKPLKFGFAFTMYCGTLAWLLSKMTRTRRLGWWLGAAFGVAAVVEVIAITIQAARGTFSHFNGNTDTVTQMLTPILTTGVGVLFFGNVVIAILVLLQRTTDRALTRAIRAGIVLAVLGTCVPILYLTTGIYPRTVTDANGIQVKMWQGHGVGDPDGHGMALTNWSVTGGDWRVAHFAGLHGIQVLLLVAGLLIALSARVVWLRDEMVRARLVGIACFAYFGLFAIVFWQAHRGQSLIHPDAPTLLIFAAVVLVATVAAAIVSVRASRTHQKERARAHLRHS